MNTPNLYGHIILIKNKDNIYFLLVNNETINKIAGDILHCENIYNKPLKVEPFLYNGGLSPHMIQLIINEELNSTRNTYYCFMNSIKKYKNIQISKNKLFVHTKL